MNVSFVEWKQWDMSVWFSMRITEIADVFEHVILAGAKKILSV